MDEYTIYCTPEQTKKAIELGAKIVPYVNEEASPIQPHFKIGNDKRWLLCFCPTVEQMCNWLRKEKDIHIIPNFVTKAHKYEPVIYLPNEDKTYSKVIIPTYTTYEEAISIGIDTVIMSLKD